MAYADTDHLFSQPIRTYKANDPYYYEVDNIPIRQLEENILWAKDQIDSLLTPLPAGEEPQVGTPLFVGDDIDLEHIKQMRPKFVGARNIKVQAGRFTSRINDAYQVNDSLAQMVANYVDGSCSNFPQLTQSETTAFFDAIWASYTTKLTTASFVSCPGESNEAAAYRANGLETMFTFYISKNFGDPIPTATTTTYGAPEYLGDGSGRGKTWPALWHSNIDDIGTSIQRIDWSKLNILHLKLVQHWRGVIRTSVVDFRGDTIQIPAFDQYDYFYTEEVQGEEVVTSLDDLATQRIDLVVVYSHPIDSSGTALTEYNGVSPIGHAGGIAPGTPKKILEPRLGLIRGAGIGIKRTADEKIELLDKRIAPGEQKILANLNDHTDGGSNTGIKLSNGSIVHGSFPSPDDLANIAPNLTTALGDDNIQLVGQTALPIAYVVVTKGSVNLTQEDIIDIRPFLRTTELAYNERAGIAGAQPALSLANPAVGAAQLDAVVKCIESQIAPPSDPVINTSPAAIMSYRDVVMGGMMWGAEGVFLGMNTTTNGPMDQTTGGQTWADTLGTQARREYLRGLYTGQVSKGGAFPLLRWCGDTESSEGLKGNYLDLPDTREVSMYPEWDRMIDDDTLDSVINIINGAYPGNYYNWCEGTTTRGVPPGNSDAAWGNGNITISRLPFLRKKLILKFGENITAYDVKTNFANCIPMSDNQGVAMERQNGASPINPGFDVPNGEGHSGNLDPQVQLATAGNIAFRNNGGNGQIFVNKTGIYIDPSDGARTAEITIVVPGVMVQNQNTSDGDAATMLFEVWAAGCPNTTGGINAGHQTQNFVPFGIQMTIGQSFGATHNTIPRPKIGVASFPTVAFEVVGYGSNKNYDPVVFGETGQGLTGTAGNLEWVIGGAADDVPPYSPTGTVINLTGA